MNIPSFKTLILWVGLTISIFQTHATWAGIPSGALLSCYGLATADGIGGVFPVVPLGDVNNDGVPDILTAQIYANPTGFG